MDFFSLSLALDFDAVGLDVEELGDEAVPELDLPLAVLPV